MAQPLSTLRDNMDVDSKATKWANSYGSPVWTGGRVRLPYKFAYDAGIRSTDYFDLSESSIFAQIQILPNATGRESYMSLWADANNRIELLVAEGNLMRSTLINGVRTTVNTGVVYNAVNHAWWRIREHNAIVYFETSPDCRSWSIVGSQKIPFSIQTVRPMFYAANWNVNESSLYMWVDNVNVLPYFEEPLFPQTKIEVAWNNAPLDASPTWTDITTFVNDFDTKLGRNYEMADFETGSLGMSLDNSDGRFTPGKKAVALYDNLTRNSSFEVNTNGWSSARCTISRSNDWSASGGYSAKVVVTDASAVSYTYSGPEISAGGSRYPYAAGDYIHTEWMVVSPTNVRVVASVVGYDAALASTGSILANKTYDIPANTPTRVVTSGTSINANGTTVGALPLLYMYNYGTSAAAAVGTTIYIDNHMYIRNQGSPSGFFDGYSEFATWNGVVGSSASKMWAPNYGSNVRPGKPIRVTAARPRNVSLGDASRFDLKSLTGWTTFSSAGATGGSSSALLGSYVSVTSGTGTLSDYTRIYNTTLDTQCVTGETLQFTVRMRAAPTNTRNASVRVVVAFYDANGVQTGATAVSVQSLAAGTDWAEYTTNPVTAPNHTVSFRVMLENYADTTAATVWFGKVTLIPDWQPVFYGMTESFKVTYPGGGDYSECSVDAVDLTKYLEALILKSPLAEVVSARAPHAFVRFNESVNSQSVANSGVYTDKWEASAAVMTSKSGGGVIKFQEPGVTEFTDKSVYVESSDSAYTKGKAFRLASATAGFSIASDLTVQGWFKTPVSVPTNTMYLTGLQTELGTPNSQFNVLMVTDGTLRVNVSSGSSGTVGTVIGTKALNDNAWHHIVVRTSNAGKTWTLWVDGAQDGSTLTLASTPLWAVGRQAIYVGALYTSSTRTMQYASTGWFSTWSFTNTGWTDAQITEIYSAGTGGGTFSGDNEVTRINRALDWVNFPSAWRNLGTPKTVLQSMDVAGTSAMDAIKNAAKDAGGYAFIGKDGMLNYYNRQYRLNKPVSFALSEAENLMPENDIEFEQDDQNVINSLNVKRVYGAEFVIEDANSITQYGKRKGSVELAISDDLEAYDAGSWRLYLYKDSITRLPNIAFMPSTGGMRLWNVALTLNIGDVIRLDRLPANVPDVGTDYFIESISHRVQASTNTWLTVYELSPATKYRTAWVLDDINYSVLDSTTVAVY